MQIDNRGITTAHKTWQSVLGRNAGFSFPLFCRATKKQSENLPRFIAKPSDCLKTPNNIQNC